MAVLGSKSSETANTEPALATKVAKDYWSGFIFCLSMIFVLNKLYLYLKNDYEQKINYLTVIYLNTSQW